MLWDFPKIKTKPYFLYFIQDCVGSAFCCWILERNICAFSPTSPTFLVLPQVKLPCYFKNKKKLKTHGRSLLKNIKMRKGGLHVYMSPIRSMQFPHVSIPGTFKDVCTILSRDFNKTPDLVSYQLDTNTVLW